LEQVLLFAIVGFLAQLVDGALGMAYGLISTTVLLAFGVLPATASATTHVAEMFTTAASGIAHIARRNVDYRTLFRLAPAGVVGGVLGVYVVTAVDGATIRPFVVAYLGLMGALILYRGLKPKRKKVFSTHYSAVLGVAGGFTDAIGGGGWGPMVSSTMMASGGEPRYVIGTVNTAEFLVTAAISTTFIWALLSGHWENADGIRNHAGAVAGLILGGILAAPISSLIVKRVPAKRLAFSVGTLVLALCFYQGWQLVGLRL
jgi:uncharacterized membrane protein YfcA